MFGNMRKNIHVVNYFHVFRSLIKTVLVHFAVYVISIFVLHIEERTVVKPVATKQSELSSVKQITCTLVFISKQKYTSLI